MALNIQSEHIFLSSAMRMTLMLTSDVCDDGFHPFFYSYNIEINYCFTFVRFSFENNFPTEDSERGSRREGRMALIKRQNKVKAKKCLRILCTSLLFCHVEYKHQSYSEIYEFYDVEEVELCWRKACE